MSSANRITLAKNAAKAVLKTLAWKDKVCIITFHSSVADVYPLTYVTDDVRASMNTWLDSHVVASGGTAFIQPLLLAFDALDADPGCSNVILMLSDGVAYFSEANYATTQTRAENNDVTLFTYALGSGKSASSCPAGYTARFACIPCFCCFFRN